MLDPWPNWSLPSIAFAGGRNCRDLLGKATRTVTSITVAAAVVLSGTGAGQAQSSFSDLSSLLSSHSSLPGEPIAHHGLVERLRSAVESLHELTGVPVNVKLRQRAQEYADRAAAGEFEYGPVSEDPGAAGIYGEAGEGVHVIVRQLTPQRAELWAESLEDVYPEIPEDLDERLRAGSYAVARDGEHVYLVYAGEIPLWPEGVLRSDAHDWARPHGGKKKRPQQDSNPRPTG